MMDFDIFISYAREDRASAQRLSVALEGQGWSVWWDRIIPAGRTFDDVIEEAIGASRSVVVLWSKHSVTSDWVRNEAADGADRKILVPVLIEQPGPWKIPWAYRRIHAADLTEWDGDHDGTSFQGLVRDLTAVLGPPKPNLKPGQSRRRKKSSKVQPRPQRGKKQPEEGEPAPGTARKLALDGLEYVWIPPGRFQMGAVPGDDEAEDWEKPRHAVGVTQGFWLAKTPVTVKAYRRFAEATGRGMPPAPGFNAEWEKADHPIVDVTWDDAGAYCEWAGGRLPTEAEWEYAARGGRDGWKYPNGNEITKADAHFNAKGTCSIGQYPSNGYKLLDMAGNVWEWCSDWFDESYYAKSSERDPSGPSKGNSRVVRGGSWYVNYPRVLRVSYRSGVEPDSRNLLLGFRCTREVSP